MKRIGRQCQPSPAQLTADARVERFAARTAVIAPAIGTEVVGGDVVVQPATRPLQLRADAERAVGAGVHAQPPRVAGLALRAPRSEEHTSELQSQSNLVCRLLLEKKKKQINTPSMHA